MGNIVKVNLRQPESYKEFITYASFDSNPYSDNRAIAINLDVTKQELDSLFSTKKYERPYLPEYFNPLEELLGELWTTESETLAFHLVVDKVNEFIPKIRVDSESTFSFENNTIKMNLIFYYKNDYNRTLYNYERLFDVVT